MPGLHATLSPSAASRWIKCPASIRMEEQVPQQPDSVYAREGTAAHALAELKARELILNEGPGDVEAWRVEHGVKPDAEAEMEEHALAYVDLLRSRLAANPGSVLLLEQRLPTGIKDCWGTSDAVIVSPTVVESVDFKYGLGVKVDAQANPQLRLYGVGALDTYGDLLGEVEVVRLTVHQPRLGHTDTEEIAADDLRAWRDSIKPVAEVALGPDAPFSPGDDTCRWCPASGRCRAQMEYAVKRDFAKPDTLDEAEVAELLERVPAIEQWCAALRDYALNRVYSEGVPIPGYKVVMSGGRRSITDPEGALNALLAIGYQADQVSQRKMKGIGELETLLKGDFDVAVGPFVKKGRGSPSLVPESDKRSAINPEAQAVEDFK
jgi:hypothetical protein